MPRLVNVYLDREERAHATPPWDIYAGSPTALQLPHARDLRKGLDTEAFRRRWTA